MNSLTQVIYKRGLAFTYLNFKNLELLNEEYVRQNDSYGLTTLRNRHVTFDKGQAKLHFRGKSGLRREAIIEDRRLVRLLKALKTLPGTHLFQYVDADGKSHLADSVAVNDYLNEQAKHTFTAKDFRTWKASALAAGLLFEFGDAELQAARKRTMNHTVAAVAELLGNTKTVCRKYYIHAGLLETCLDGKLSETFQRFKPRRRAAFSREEQILAHFLRRWPRP